MQMLSLVFDALRIDVFIVYHFVLFCRPDTLNNLLFLNAKPNSNSTKNCLCTSNLDSDVGKLLHFDNI